MSEETPTKYYRRIRSFVRREGRITKGQQRALDELLPRFKIDLEGRIDIQKAFGRAAPVHIEIGIGNGENLTHLAQLYPEVNFIGIEVHRPGVGNCLLNIEKHELTNVRVICEDAVDVLHEHVSDDDIDKVYIFFPDPWHKKKHHKRRLVQPDFIAMLAKKIKPDGILHLATDWEDYALHMMEVISANDSFENLAGEGNYSDRPEYRTLTKFERRGQRLGHGVWDLLFKRK